MPAHDLRGLRRDFYAAWRLGLVRTGYAAYDEIPEGLPWPDSEGFVNVVRLDAYSWPESKDAPTPLVLRVCVNDYQPVHEPRGVAQLRWRMIPPTELNTRVEITFMPHESKAVADWLPAWLAWRLDPALKIPPPPTCLTKLCNWTEPTYVYVWTPAADTAFTHYQGTTHRRRIVES